MWLFLFLFCWRGGEAASKTRGPRPWPRIYPAECRSPQRLTYPLLLRLYSIRSLAVPHVTWLVGEFYGVLLICFRFLCGLFRDCLPVFVYYFLLCPDGSCWILIDYRFFPGVALAGADSDEQIALFKNINLLDLIFGGFFRLDGLGTPYRDYPAPGLRILFWWPYFEPLSSLFICLSSLASFFPVIFCAILVLGVVPFFSFFLFQPTRCSSELVFFVYLFPTKSGSVLSFSARNHWLGFSREPCRWAHIVIMTNAGISFAFNQLRKQY